MKGPNSKWGFAGLAAGGLLLGGCGFGPSGPTTVTPPPTTTVSAASPAAPGTTSADVASPTTVITGTTGESDAGAATPTTVLVIGDFGDGSEAELEVAAAMEDFAQAETITALVTTGDNFYRDDVAVIWDQPFGWLSRMAIPVYPAWGNHDVESSSRRQAVTDALRPPGRWYQVSLGAATFVMLDSNDVGNPDQLAWLTSVLTAANDGPLIVGFHHPAYSCARHGSTDSVISLWVPMFEAGGVDLVLSGHDHDYQRFERNGVTYVVTGGGGRNLYEIGSCPDGTPKPLAGDDTHHHYVALSISPGGIRGEVLGPDGAILDSFTVPAVP